MRILYLDLDALNPSHLSCYGYTRDTSPAIDRIAEDGLRCDNVYTSDAPCLPSRTAFNQGRFGIQTGVVGHGGTAADLRIQGPGRAIRSCFEDDALPRQLQLAGVHTAMISPFGQRHAAHHIYAGFSEFYNTGKLGKESAEHVMPVVSRWLGEHAADDDWYLHVNFWDIHAPYRTPLTYGNPFDHSPLPDMYTPELVADHARRGGPHSSRDLGMYDDPDTEQYPRLPLRADTPEGLKMWIDGCDTAIHYVDRAIASIVKTLKDAGVYEDTAIIISADHGENQGHLGIYGEHGTADHATCRVPFIIKWPGGVRGKVDEQLHYHLDWAPTLTKLLSEDQAIPPQWDGQAFVDTVLHGVPQGRDELILSQCAHVCQRAVRFDHQNSDITRQWLYIRTYHDGFHPFPKHMLFDLMSDPLEQNNLALSHREVVREASFKLAEWHDAQMTKMTRTSGSVIDPLWTVMSEGGPFYAQSQPGHGQPQAGLARYLDRLENTDRPEAAKRLRDQYSS